MSFDDGAHWQSLRLNMPATSVRDLIVKDDDLVAATHGRGFQVLDDITPLRQIDATSEAQAAILFRPTVAWRVRWNMSTDMPWPVEEPTGPNPPEGAIINYYLKAAAQGPVTLEILNTAGRLVRRYSSDDPVAAIPEPPNAPVPTYWYRPPQTLATAAGHAPVPVGRALPAAAGRRRGGGRGGLPITAIPFNTAMAPGTPWVSPGTYTVKLTVDGKSYTQPIVVKQDPRVKTPALVMNQVYTLTNSMYYGAVDAQQAATVVGQLRAQAAALAPKAQGPAAAALASVREAGGGARGPAAGSRREASVAAADSAAAAARRRRHPTRCGLSAPLLGEPDELDAVGRRRADGGHARGGDRGAGRGGEGDGALECVEDGGTGRLEHRARERGVGDAEV